MSLTLSQAFYDLKKNLQPLYDEREAAALAHEVLHFVTGLDKVQRLMQKETPFTDQQQIQYSAAAADLLTGRPLQYITGSAWFMNREYHVNEHVLIPRPETEELVDWVIREYKNTAPSILDIGTGSGCIPISLKLAIGDAQVSSCDISHDALNIATGNAASLNADIQFIRLDFLDAARHGRLGNYDIIVSNPPYIPAAEREKLHTNVIDHEPGIALFVPDDDALVFYKAIALFGKQHLNAGGNIYCELDAGHAQECKALFEDAGYKDVVLRKDMNDNWRMLKAGR